MLYLIDPRGAVWSADTTIGRARARARVDGRPVDDSKQAYAHAFVVLAASSATAAGRPGAKQLLDEALASLDEENRACDHVTLQ